jgi:hypothetical protein
MRRGAYGRDKILHEMWSVGGSDASDPAISNNERQRF